MKTHESEIADAISRSLDGAKVDIDLEAGLVWQKKPKQVAEFLKLHIDDFELKERRLLYIKSVELSHEEMVSLLVYRLQYEQDATALKLMETILMDKMTVEDVGRHLDQEFHCQSSIADDVVRKLRSRHRAMNSTQSHSDWFSRLFRKGR
jgi:hypothetical protein